MTGLFDLAAAAVLIALAIWAIAAADRREIELEVAAVDLPPVFRIIVDRPALYDWAKEPIYYRDRVYNTRYGSQVVADELHSRILEP